MAVSPEFYCMLRYGKACSVYFEALAKPDTSPVKCTDNVVKNAVVVRYSGVSVSEAMCGAHMSSLRQMLHVHTVSDRQVTSNRTVSVNIQQRDKVAGMAPVETTVKIVTVSSTFSP